MTSSIQAPQQFKQSSRKGKKAWRKNVDVTAVQAGLDSLRDEEIKGGVIAEKSSADLFTIDPNPSSEIQTAYLKHHKPLKADEILAQRSAIPAVSARKRPGDRVTDGIINPKPKRRKTDWVSNKELQRLRGIAYTAQPVLTDPSQETETASHDPWAISPPKPLTSDQDLPLGPKPKAAIPPKSIKRAPEPQTASGKQIRAIPNPKAGTSYNPVFRDWDDLLLKEGDKEVAAERQRLADEALEKEKQALIATAQAEVELPSDDDESAWEGIESEREGEFQLSTKRPERKTPSQRNRAIRRKEAERKEKHEKQMKKRRAQQEQIREIVKKMEEREQKKGKIVKMEVDGESEDEVDDEVLKRRRGKPAILSKPLEIVLPEELRESLRLLKPEGNILNDRFRNLLVQGKVDARKRIVQPRTVKRTVTEKWSYKDWKLR